MTEIGSRATHWATRAFAKGGCAARLRSMGVLSRESRYRGVSMKWQRVLGVHQTSSTTSLPKPVLAEVGRFGRCRRLQVRHWLRGDPIVACVYGKDFCKPGALEEECDIESPDDPRLCKRLASSAPSWRAHFRSQTTTAPWVTTSWATLIPRSVGLCTGSSTRAAGSRAS